MERFTEQEIQGALKERHSPQIQDRLTAGRVAVAGLGGPVHIHIHLLFCQM